MGNSMHGGRIGMEILLAREQKRKKKFFSQAALAAREIVFFLQRFPEKQIKFFSKEKIGVLKYERSECFNLAIFRVRNGFYLVFCRNRDWNGVFLMFLTFFFEPFLVGKLMKENLLRKVRKSEKRKVKNIRKIIV